MPITSIFILAGIIFAFIVFAVALAWGEYQTRNINRSGRQHAGTSAEIHSLKTTARDADRRGSFIASGGAVQEKANHQERI